MMPQFPLLLAEETARIRLQLGRIQSNADWVPPVAALIAIFLFVRLMYRRDAVDLPRAVGWIFTVLRCAAFVGLLVLYLQPQWRVEREVVQNSRVAILVDTSMSMGLTDAVAGSSSAPATRLQHVVASLSQTDVVRRLRATHDVVLLRFDETITRLAVLTKLPRNGEADSAGAQGNGAEGPATTTGDWATSRQSGGVVATGATGGPAAKNAADWIAALRPVGNQTRLGHALKQVLNDERGSPLAGLIVVSDGGQNADPSPEGALELARDAKIPIYTVGVGSAQRPVNARVFEIESPERAHVGDPYTVTAVLRSQGLAGQSVGVQLLVRDASKGGERLLQSSQAILGGDSEAVPVKFQVTPEEPARRQHIVRITPPRADSNPDDNQREVDVEVVDRKTRVLLFAGGPQREYQFVKSLLYRDKGTTMDILLQTAKEGVSQEAAHLLDTFPSTREEMFAYDCVIALDPQWQQLNPTQLGLLEAWIAEQGGGLIAVAGSVHTGQTVGGWVQELGMAKIRALYPVDFHRRVSVSDGDVSSAKDAWPIDFTREGREAEFLWLADTDSASQAAWAEFPGVFTAFQVRGPKPGATIYAHFSDPQAAVGNQKSIYMAGQFYGSGRVFYLGSGELWRLRRVSEGYFEQFYTRLVRHVAQGRLLRQSRHGALLLDKDRYLLGNTIEIRVQLSNAKFQPLEAATAIVEVYAPDHSVQTLSLRPEGTRPGMYRGQLAVLQEGVYRLELPIPDAPQERISRRIQVRVPNLERENPQRNDLLLAHIASATEAMYYPDLNSAFDASAPEAVATFLKDKTKTSIYTAAPDALWEESWLRWVLWTTIGLLCGEWLLRRLLRLA